MGILIAAAAGALFAGVSFANQPSDSAGTVKCMGVNSCKGQSACKTAHNSCKGKNHCKGKGVMMVATEKDCTDMKGTVAKD